MTDRRNTLPKKEGGLTEAYKTITDLQTRAWELKRKYPDFKENDVRSYIMGEFIVCLSNSFLSLRLAMEINDGNFNQWLIKLFKKTGKNPTVVNPLLVETTKGNYLTGLKVLLFMDIFNKFESKIRIIVRTVVKNNPSLNLTGEDKFWKIRKKFFKGFLKLKSNELKGLELYSELRNTIHNNGYYLPPINMKSKKKTQDRTITFSGVKCKLFYNASINCLSWELIHKLVINFYTITEIIYLNKKIKSISFIMDPVTKVRRPKVKETF